VGCLVESGGCERAGTEPFIEHLNRLGKTRYVYKSCLDVLNRETPQPETLYVDEILNESVVIERKSIIWPPNYARGHANDHFVREQISKELDRIEFKDLYCLQLPWLIEGTKDELRAFSRGVAAQIKTLYFSLELGQVVRSRSRPGREWTFYIQPEEERYEEAPDQGLGFVWLYKGYDEALVQAERLPPELEKALNTIYRSCSRKFAGYLGSHRILLLHPYGDLVHMPGSWWDEALTKCPPPPIVNEAWLALFDDEFGAWDFQCLAKN
jgi:hypothetical protein